VISLYRFKLSTFVTRKEILIAYFRSFVQKRVPDSQISPCRNIVNEYAKEPVESEQRDVDIVFGKVCGQFGQFFG
jgi:hypothetical protein